jgi:hypothetical protein
MKKSANSQLLSDERVSSNEKLKLSVYIKKASIIKMNTLISLTNSTSRNEVIEKSVDFYFGYITSQFSQEYLCSVFGTKMEGLVGTLGTRISRGNFRYAVQLEMLARMLASVLRLSGEQYGKLRKRAVDEVKHTNGTLDISKIIDDVKSEI